MERIKTAALYVFLGLLAYMPLHIFLSTWFGSTFNWLDFAKVAKDGVLVVGVLCALAVTSKKHLINIARMRVVQLILAYAALTVLFAATKPTDQDAEILGVVYNTRFLLMFIYGLLLTEHYKHAWLTKRAFMIVGAVGFAVMIFGLLQYTVIPETFLNWFGYNRENGVLPAFFIDDKPGLERIMSTLRDPNSYGSYLIILTSMFFALLVRTKDVQLKNIATGLLGLAGLNLLFTFSRSAWIGVALAVTTVFILSTNTSHVKVFAKKYWGLVAVGVILCIGLLAASWNTYLVQNVVFHADESTVLEDPNQLRGRFLTESIDRVEENPLGHGPGTAGLASIKNDQQTILNENYYLQIAHEVGVIGLLLFLAILVSLVKYLYRLRSNTYAVILLAGLTGISFTNLLVHIWSNEAVAYTWWALTSLVVSQVFLVDDRDKAARQTRKSKSS